MSGSDDEVLIVGETRAGGDPASGDDRAAKRPRNGADLGGAPSIANNQPRSVPPSKTRPSIAEMKRTFDAMQEASPPEGPTERVGLMNIINSTPIAAQCAVHARQATLATRDATAVLW